MYYVYEIIDPRTGQIIYVGKGKGRRYLAHERIAIQGLKPTNPRLNNKLRRILDRGLRPIYTFVQIGLTEEDAYLLEQQITMKIGLSNLCNLKHGGTSGATFTPEIRERLRHLAALRDKGFWTNPARCQKISLSRTGVPRSPTTRQKLSIALSGKSFVDRFGEERAAEIITRIRRTQMGQKRPAQSAAMKGRLTGQSNPMYGKTLSDEQKEIRRQRCLSDLNPGKNKSEETRHRISESKRGKAGPKHTEETKRKMAEARRLYWEKRHASDQ